MAISADAVRTFLREQANGAREHGDEDTAYLFLAADGFIDQLQVSLPKLHSTEQLAGRLSEQAKEQTLRLGEESKRADGNHKWGTSLLAEVNALTGRLDTLREALECLLPGLIIDRRYAEPDDDIAALDSRVKTASDALFAAAVEAPAPFEAVLTCSVDGCGTRLRITSDKSFKLDEAPWKCPTHEPPWPRVVERQKP